MASSGTYALAPEIAEFQDHAFRLCGINVATLTHQHSKDARFALNMMFSYWATKGVLLFTVDVQTQTVTKSDPTYSASAGTLALMEVTVKRDDVETEVHRMDRDEYQLIPNKTNEGLPTRVYYDRITNIYTLWNTPENSTDIITYWRLRRIQDVTKAAETPDVPYEWYAALVYGLAEFLADIYAPEKVQILTAKAGERFAQADQFNRQRVNTSFGM